MPFFQDCYRRINVREYSRLMKISPPTASKLLSSYSQEISILESKDVLARISGLRLNILELLN